MRAVCDLGTNILMTKSLQKNDNADASYQERNSFSTNGMSKIYCKTCCDID
jgi:hypothetical protein